jgi:transposase-like protein
MGRTKTRRALREDRLRIVELALAGTTTADIARQLRLERHYVARWRRRLSKVGDISDAGRSGRPRKRTAVVVKRVRLMLCGKKRRSTRAVAAELTAGGTAVCQRTVVNAAHDAQLLPHHPPKKPVLTASDKHRRLQFARHHSKTNWRRVLFVDESTRALYAVPNRHNDVTWGPRGSSVQPAETRQSFGPASAVRMCGGVSAAGKTTLHLFSNSLDANGYCDILRSTILPDGDSLFSGTDWTLLQDRAPYHRAPTVTAFLDNQHPQHMGATWPPHSPDLNVIENVWSIVKHAVDSDRPTTRVALVRTVRRAWARLPQQQIDSMINSMPQRLRAVIKAGGGHTSY